MKARIRMQGFLICLGVVALIFFYKYLLPDPVGKGTRYIRSVAGLLAVLLGYLLRISARGFKAERNPDGKTLVCEGPYNLMRNPMYFGTLLIGLGVVLAAFRIWVGGIFLVIYLSIYIPQISREEERLKGYFGERFRNYQLTTPKFFPSPSALLKTRPEQYLMLKWPWIKKELPSLSAVLAVLTGITIWNYFR